MRRSSKWMLAGAILLCSMVPGQVFAQCASGGCFTPTEPSQIFTDPGCSDEGCGPMEGCSSGSLIRSCESSLSKCRKGFSGLLKGCGKGLSTCGAGIGKGLMLCGAGIGNGISMCGSGLGTGMSMCGRGLGNGLSMCGDGLSKCKDRMSKLCQRRSDSGCTDIGCGEGGGCGCGEGCGMSFGR